MIHTKTLKFSHNDVDFEATVTYSDVPFRPTLHMGKKDAFYDIELLKPEILHCDGEIGSIHPTISLLLYKDNKEMRYVYVEDLDYLEQYRVNVYEKAIKKILYCYFNKEVISEYEKKVELFEQCVDKKVSKKLETLKEQRLALRKQLRSGAIDNKTYQKLYRALRLAKEALEIKVFRLKERYRKRYFKCCELKNKYRIVPEDADKSCNNELYPCKITAWLKRRIESS